MKLKVRGTPRFNRNAAFVVLALAASLASVNSTARPLAISQNASAENHKPLVIAHRGGALSVRA